MEAPPRAFLGPRLDVVVLRRATPPILATDGAPLAGSTADLHTWRIGGLDQGVLVRGHEEEAPLLFLLPDGPGLAPIHLARCFQNELERAFLVANWDPPGVGLSASQPLPPERLALDRLLEDVIAVARRLLETYGRDRLTLVGHGFGSILGLRAAVAHPKLFDAYIGSSQVVSAVENERRALAWVAEVAEAKGLGTVVTEVERLPEPPLDREGSDRLSRWLREFGGRVLDGPRAWGWAALRNGIPEYSFLDLLRLRGERRRAESALFRELRTVDLRERVRRVELPVFLLAGRYDRVNDPELARDLLRAIDAPRKGWAWIEEAAHEAPFEQPEAWAAALAHFAHDARGPAAPSWTVAG